MHVAGAKEPAVPSRELWRIGLLLVLLGCLLASVAWKTGVTVDEPAHLLSAHLYWMGQDNLHPGDMPPAIKIVGGWVSHLFSLPVPYDRKELWAERKEWQLAQAMMERLHAPLLRRIFFFSRLPIIVFALLACLVLWLWARRLYSPRTAFLLALLFCLSPTVLAHGSLFKNDVAASFGYLLFWYRGWMYWQVPSRANAAWLGLGLLAAMLAKLSLLILVPIAPAIVVARYFAGRARSGRSLAIHSLLLVAVAYAGIAAAWQFRMNAVTGDEIRTWQAKPGIHPAIPAIAQLLGGIPTPPQLREGVIALVESDAQVSGVYLLGEVYEKGHPLYFLIAMATKTHVPLLLLLATTMVLLTVDFVRRRIVTADCLWLIPPVLYLTLASASSLQLGVRLVLPALVGFLLWSGRAVEFLSKRRATIGVLCVLLAWMAARTAFQYPNYIAFFNSLAGGSDKGIRYLSDSNLDWGQDLPALADYMDRNPIPKIHLAYFGNDNPWAYFKEERIIPIAPPWSESLVTGPRLNPEPGYYAISATLLTGQLFQPRYRDYYHVFREATPIDKAGYSIFIYKLP